MAYDFDEALEDFLKHRPGWLGNFTTRTAPGAMPSGTRIVKATNEPNDAHAVGTTGTVLGSMLHPQKGICYFVNWDGEHKIAVAVVAWKIKEAS